MPEPTATNNDEKKGNLPDDVTKVLEELKDKLDARLPAKEEPAPVPAGPSLADQRAALQKRLGFNDEQMSAHEEMIMKANAPVIEQAAWTRLEKKTDLDKYRKEIESELSIYPQEKRTPEIMEKIYYFVKGKHADSAPAPKPSVGSPNVPATRVSRGPGYDGANPGIPSGSGEGAGEDADAKLDDKERFVAAKLGISEADYAKSRNAGRSIRELKVPDTRTTQSMADVELRRMTGR